MKITIEYCTSRTTKKSPLCCPPTKALKRGRCLGRWACFPGGNCNSPWGYQYFHCRGCRCRFPKALSMFFVSGAIHQGIVGMAAFGFCARPWM